MHQDINGNRQEIISIEEYLRKRNVIREKENLKKSSSASRENPQGTVIELAELYI